MPQLEQYMRSSKEDDPKTRGGPAYTIGKPWERVVAGVVVLALVGGLVLVALRPPEKVGWLPDCPSRAIAGVLCAGCGSTRAAHHLLHARVETALGYNPVAVIIGPPVLMIGLWQLGVFACRGRWPGSRVRLPAWTGWAVLVALLLWSVLRNLPVQAMEWAKPPGWSQRGAGE
ncbi:MAG: hypothetical protein ACI89L_001868 [Phycisphaerales bacterium]